MALKMKEIRTMASTERLDKLKELRDELMHERGLAAMGGATPSPGKIRQIRTAIARIMTVMQEEGETQ